MSRRSSARSTSYSARSIADRSPRCCPDSRFGDKHTTETLAEKTCTSCRGAFRYLPVMKPCAFRHMRSMGAHRELRDDTYRFETRRGLTPILTMSIRVVTVFGGTGFLGRRVFSISASTNLSTSGRAAVALFAAIRGLAEFNGPTRIGGRGGARGGEPSGLRALKLSHRRDCRGRAGPAPQDRWAGGDHPSG
jgi:hypothetical protein